MSSQYPSIITALTNPNPTDKLNNPSHSGIETAQNTEITQLENFIGLAGTGSTLGTLVYDIRSAASDGGGHIQTANKGGTGQTAYTKGDLLVAQSASVLSKLVVGADNQVLTVDASQSTGVKWGTLASGGNVKTVIPLYTGEPTAADSANTTVTSSVLAKISLLTVPVPILVNKFTIQAKSATVFGLLNLAMYSEDGTTSVLSTSASIVSATSSTYTGPVSSVLIGAGNYWVAASSSNGSVTATLASFNSGTNTKFNSVVGTTALQGDLPILAGVLPASVTLGNIVFTASGPIKIRLDN